MLLTATDDAPGLISGHPLLTGALPIFALGVLVAVVEPTEFLAIT
jgi:hypothetical protein